jgi:hypothetical protein
LSILHPVPIKQTILMPSHQTLPTHTRRKIHLKSSPVLTLSLLHPDMSSSPSHIPTPPPPPPPPPPPSHMTTIPSQPALLTCPTCLSISTYHLTSPNSSPACSRCMARFKKQRHRREDELTTFPRLLEDHSGVVKEREGKGSGLLGRILEWGRGGGSRKKEDDDGNEETKSVESRSRSTSTSSKIRSEGPGNVWSI